VLVTADLRAAEEVADGRAAIVGRILEKTVDRSDADAALSDLAQLVAARQAEINEKYLSGQLRETAQALNGEMNLFSADLSRAPTAGDTRRPARPRTVHLSRARRARSAGSACSAISGSTSIKRCLACSAAMVVRCG
jgi:hypothetical protein